MSRPITRDEVVVDGRAVRVLHAGDGPAVVLVHGLGLAADFWTYHLERLADAGYRVIAPDLPGFGRSSGPAFAFTVDHAAAWLEGFARAQRIERAVWIGHSVSCQYVLRLAVRRPDLAAGLLLAAPTGEPGRMRWLAQLLALARTAPRESPRLVTRILGSYFSTPPTRVIGMWLGARRDLALPDAARVRCPLRVVLGGRDPVVPPSFARALVQAAPDADIVVIEESAHGVALAPAAPFVDVVEAFVRSTYAQAAVENGGARGGEAVETA
jgi:2-hydroxy-6-oxonona-2,4-dienedioate hydrolase